MARRLAHDGDVEMGDGGPSAGDRHALDRAGSPPKRKPPLASTFKENRFGGGDAATADRSEGNARLCSPLGGALDEIGSPTSGREEKQENKKTSASGMSGTGPRDGRCAPRESTT